MSKRSINQILDGSSPKSFDEWLALERALREARDVLKGIQMLVDTQAEDERIWFVAENAAEGYLQAQLRKLHTAIEAAPLLKKWDKHD